MRTELKTVLHLPAHDVQVRLFMKKGQYHLEISYRWFFDWVSRKVYNYPEEEAFDAYLRCALQLRDSMRIKSKVKGHYDFFARLAGRVECFLEDGCWVSPGSRRQD